MKREVGEVITVDNEQYTILDTVLYEGKDYIFTNKVKGEEPSETYIIFEYYEDGVNGSVSEVSDPKLLERLIPICSKNIQKIIDVMNLKEKYDI